MDQSNAPILDALAAVERGNIAGFGGPGHDEGRAASADVVALLVKQAFQADVLTPKGLDDRTESFGVMQQAYRLAAEAWGADLCRFSTGGSTQSIQTAIAAVAGPGDTVLIAGNAHKAAFSTAVFAGVNLVTIPPVIDRERDVEHGTDPETLARLLDAHPAAKAALVISPTFFGVTSDIPALAEICHARGVPLIVDAAWGSAYPFCDRLPENPLRQGADAMVVSVHKTMGALAQGSFMLVTGDLIDRERFVWAFEMLQCTSPSVPILASLDATRRAHVADGQHLWGRVIDLAASVRDRLSDLTDVAVYGREMIGGPGAHDLDPTFLILDVRKLGLSGYEADEWLQAERRVSAVLGDLRHIGFSFSLGTTEQDANRLVQGIRDLLVAAKDGDDRFHRVPDDAPGYASLQPAMASAPALPPPRAAAAKFDRVPYAHAAGRIAGQSVAIVPPAIPRLLPGQAITPAHVAFLQANLEAGAFILDPDEHGDGLIRVVREA